MDVLRFMLQLCNNGFINGCSLSHKNNLATYILQTPMVQQMGILVRCHLLLGFY